MVKKPAKPTRKSPAKSKAKPKSKPRSPKPAARKAAKPKGKRPAKPAAKKTAKAKPANRKAAPKKPVRKTVAKAAKKPGAKPKVLVKVTAKPAAKGKPAAKAVAPKVSPKHAKLVAAKPAARVAGKLPAVAKAGKPAQPPKVVPVAAKGGPVATAEKGKPVAAGKAPATPAHKPTPGEIAAKLAGKRAEDASKKGRNGKHAEIAPRVLTPADVEARKRRLKTLIVLGKERGYLTYAEINDHLPDDILDAEQIEGVISMIGDMGILVYDEAPDAETLLMSESPATVPAEDVEEEAEAAASTLDSEFGRTTDPVRMYMREMGSVELLTREGEIEIAKRIEEGLKHMIMAISACPMTVAQILDLAGKIEKDELKIDDLVDGLMDFKE